MFFNSTTLGATMPLLVEMLLLSWEHFLTVFRTLKALFIRAKNVYNLTRLLSRKYSNLYFSPNWIDTIFVRAYEDRMDLLRAVIMGPAGTPYHDGLFFFDIYFPPQYPNVPPVIFSWLALVYQLIIFLVSSVCFMDHGMISWFYTDGELPCWWFAA